MLERPQSRFVWEEGGGGTAWFPWTWRHVGSVVSLRATSSLGVHATREVRGEGLQNLAQELPSGGAATRGAKNSVSKRGLDLFSDKTVSLSEACT